MKKKVSDKVKWSFSKGVWAAKPVGQSKKVSSQLRRRKGRTRNCASLKEDNKKLKRTQKMSEKVGKGKEERSSKTREGTARVIMGCDRPSQLQVVEMGRTMQG